MKWAFLCVLKYKRLRGLKENAARKLSRIIIVFDKQKVSAGGVVIHKKITTVGILWFLIASSGSGCCFRCQSLMSEKIGRLKRRGLQLKSRGSRYDLE